MYTSVVSGGAVDAVIFIFSNPDFIDWLKKKLQPIYAWTKKKLFPKQRVEIELSSMELSTDSMPENICFYIFYFFILINKIIGTANIQNQASEEGENSTNKKIEKREKSLPLIV